MDEVELPRRVPARVALLAWLYGLSGASCLLGALAPLAPDTPVGLLAGLAGTGLTVGAALWAAGPQVPAVLLHGAQLLVAVLVALLASRSVTAAGVVGLGPVLIALGLYAAHFCSAAAARAHAAGAVLLVTAGVAAAPPDRVLLPWSIAALTTAVLTEAQVRLSARLRADASTDPLTGLANRRAWEAEARRSLARAGRSGEPLSIAVLDLDDFKVVNDRDGHGAGDRVLRDLAAHWTRRLRTSDLLGRHGGDEFVVCLPGTDLAGAREVLGRLDPDTAPIGWSVGAATAGPGDTLTTLLQRADEELYSSKRGRRAAPGRS
ncbi:GGDEF domain-containing protein [Modestobacter marinus]|uniref:GGDEF domain-containing protein n=1 Tax=Modestobacter marinus TaxID=477641 RepID=UPI001C96FA19|nr:GGDEF domain-containing protein [Modestobacter marinus]